MESITCHYKCSTCQRLNTESSLLHLRAPTHWHEAQGRFGNSPWWPVLVFLAVLGDHPDLVVQKTQKHLWPLGSLAVLGCPLDIMEALLACSFSAWKLLLKEDVSPNNLSQVCVWQRGSQLSGLSSHWTSRETNINSDVWYWLLFIYLFSDIRYFSIVQLRIWIQISTDTIYTVVELTHYA